MSYSTQLVTYRIPIQKLLLSLLGLGLGFAPCLGQPSEQCVAHTKKAVVTIEWKPVLSAYESIWSGVDTGKHGTGFVLDTTQGYILTNRHVIGEVVVGTYAVVFHDGTKAAAQLVYYDPWLDFGFLQVNPTQMPPDATAIPLSEKDPVLQQAIYIMGFNEAQDFSLQTGQIATLYDILGNMPQHAVGYSLNTQGGSSGSAILNDQGACIALNFAGNSILEYGVHPAYIRYAWQCLRQGKIPVRKHIGIRTSLYSLADAVRYRNFPKEKQQAYIKKFPLSLGQVIQVEDALFGLPAAGKLLTGDIIWAINGREIGPSLVDFDMTMNTTDAACVQLTICRHGEFKEVAVDLYDLEACKVQRLLSFGGAVFFETDDYWSGFRGDAVSSVACVQTHTADTIFDCVYTGEKGQPERGCDIRVVALDRHPIHTLDDVIQLIPHLVKKQYFTLDYTNFVPLRFSVAHNTYKVDIAYKGAIAEPRLFTFSPKTKTWQVENL